MASNGRKSPAPSRKKKTIKFKVNTSWKNLLLYGFLILLAFLIFGAFSTPQTDGGKAVPVSQIISDVKKGDVKEIQVTDEKLIATKTSGEKEEAIKEPSADVYSLFNNAGVSLKDRNVKVSVKDTSAMSGWVNLIGAVLPVLLMVGFFYFIFRQARGTQESIFSFGQSKAKLYSKDTPKVTFNDVAGVDEAKQELTEIVDFLKNPQKYKSMGARTPKGVLMIGPAGTGKTLLARSTAGEAGVTFFSMAGSEFMEMLVGVGAARVRDLFLTAKKSQPAIIFIDEVDAIGRQRGAGIMGGHDEREQTLNQILVEMDGFTPNEQIIVMAASVTGDTPIMLKRDGKVSIVPIGEFIDGYYQEGEEGVEKDLDNVLTLGFENEGSSIELAFKNSAFKQVRSVFRHKVQEIYEIAYRGGKVRATGNHSVFVRTNHGIAPKPVSQLRTGDVLVDFPYKGATKYQKNERLSTAFKLHLPVYTVTEEQERPNANYMYVMQNATYLSQSSMGQVIGVSQATVGHWLRKERMPRVLSRAYFKHSLPEEVPVTPELLRLMGYYVAEGYARKEIDFCFNKAEKDLIADVIHLMELIFQIKPHRVRTTGNAVNIVYQSRPLALFFTSHCGKGARRKHVPPFLFEAPKEYVVEFLRGLFAGDGHEDKRGRGEITSVSKQLILELNWLCRMHGIKTYMHSFTAKKGRIINGGKPLAETVAYRLGWGKRANPFSETATNDFAKLPKVLSVKKVPYDGYVYDLCGCQNEAFFGGESPVLLHNTNRPDVLDPALVRPGRFDRRVSLELPDVEGRKAILAIHAKGKPFAKDVNWDKAAKRTVGFSGADLENMLNEAAILAARLTKKAIDMSDLEEAATKVKLGPEKKRLQSEEDRRMTAYHEGGHALVAWHLPHVDPIHRVSIVSRGMTLGHTMTESIERSHETKSRLIEQIAVLMGGRAAEDLIFHELTTGASNDLEKATQVVRAMVMKFGMSDLGPLTFDQEPRTPYEQSDLSEEMAGKIDKEVGKIIDAGYKNAVTILTDLRPKLDLIAEELLKKETLDADDFANLVGPKVSADGKLGKVKARTKTKA